MQIRVSGPVDSVAHFARCCIPYVPWNLDALYVDRTASALLTAVLSMATILLARTDALGTGSII
jgi:hypothetical protein